MKTGKRIFIWIIVFIISIGLTMKESNDSKPKQQVNGYLSTEFRSQNKQIEYVVNDLKSNYSTKVSNTQSREQDFKITTSLDEVSSDNYEVMGQTPLIVVMKQKKELVEKYVESGLLRCSGEVKMKKKDAVEINFKKLMDAVIQNKKWSEFGGKDKEIRIFYPELTTEEGKLFKHFLLITANGGSYPTETEQLEASREYVENFLAQPNVKEVNVMNRLTGVNDIGTDIYVAFENNVLQLDEDKYEEKIYIAYPTETVIKKIFFESISEIGSEIQEKMDEHTGFLGSEGSIKTNISRDFRYRYEDRDIQAYRNSSTEGIWDEINFKDAYNYVEIPENYLKGRVMR